MSINFSKDFNGIGNSLVASIFSTYYGPLILLEASLKDPVFYVEKMKTLANNLKNSSKDSRDLENNVNAHLIKLKHKKGSSIFDALDRAESTCLCSTALGISAYALIDEEEFNKCYYSEVYSNKAWNTHILLRKKSRGITKNHDQGHVVKDDLYRKAYGRLPTTEPKKNVIGGILSNGGVRLSEEGKFEEGILYFNEALKVRPNDIFSIDSIGITLHRMGRYEEALLLYDQALKIAPNQIIALSSKADTLSKLKRFNEALEYHNQALRISPNDDRLLIFKGRTLAQMDREDDSIKCFDKAIRLYPDNPDIWNDKGAILAAFGRYGEALNNFEKALELDPKNSTMIYNIGKVLFLQGKLELALIKYDEVIASAPNDPEIISERNEILQKIDRSR